MGEPFTATGYDLLPIQPGLPPRRARDDRPYGIRGLIMAIRHRDLPIEGVQFHPESVLTEGGHGMLANWLAVCGMPTDSGLVGDPGGAGRRGLRLIANAQGIPRGTDADRDCVGLADLGPCRLRLIHHSPDHQRIQRRFPFCAVSSAAVPVQPADCSAANACASVQNRPRRSGIGDLVARATTRSVDRRCQLR